MESVIRVMAFDDDVGLMIAAAYLTDRNASQDRLAVGMLAFAAVAQNDDRVGLGYPGTMQNDFVARIPFDNVDVVECRVVLLVGKIDLVRIVVDDHDRPRVRTR